MKFLVPYLGTAVVLGAVVWFGVPYVKAQIGGSAASGAAPEAGVAPAPAASAAVAPAPAAVAPVAKSAPVPAPVAAAPAHASPAPAAPVATAPAEAPAVVAAPEYAPGYEPRQPGYTGPRYDWGVLAAEAQSFNAEGKPRVKLPGGTVVEKMSERQTKTGEKMFVCRVRSNRRWEEGYLFRASDIVVFQGPFAFAPKKPSDQIIDYYTKLGLREKRMAAIREEHLRKNPHFEAYRAAALAYKEAAATAKELTERRDSALGAERSRLMRELEMMKNREPKLRAELEKVEIAFKQWNSDHGDGSEQVSEDPEVLRLDKEIEDLYYIVADMIPGN